MKLEDMIFLAKMSSSNGKTMHPFRMLNPSNFSPNKKSVVIFCGNPTDNAMSAYKYMILCKSWLKKKDAVDIYTISYRAGQPIEHNGFNNKYDYKVFADKLFMNITKGPDGNILSESQICDKFDNLIFFGHSAGMFVLDQTIDNFQNSLKSQGFTENQIKNILSHVFVIGYCGYTTISAPVKTIYVSPVYDSLGSSIKSLSTFYGKKNIENSSNNLDIDKFLNFYNENTYDAMRSLLKLVSKEDCLMIHDKNSLAILPNLMNNTGPEDHGLIGLSGTVPTTNKEYSTETGKLVSKFLLFVLQYYFSTQREKESTQKQIKTFYNQSLKMFNKDKKTELELV